MWLVQLCHYPAPGNTVFQRVKLSVASRRADFEEKPGIMPPRDRAENHHLFFA